MKTISYLLILLIAIGSHLAKAQNASVEATAEKILETYPGYKETSIQDRRFKHEEIVPLIERLQGKPGFEISVVGQSVEKRNIYLVRIGNGPTPVLLWSQMHGDEPTATMAIMDLFNFFADAGGPLDDWRQLLIKDLSLYFIPMLNPDGAERFQRRNALDIDLNRDAVRQQTPEAQILKRLRDSLQAVWGFNLHDQSRYYSVGRSGMTASFSFLAPAYNFEKDINPVRERSMQLIVELDQLIEQYIPGQVARYDDEFEPRAFGDNMQKWGTSTILIESGAYPGDPEKQQLRRYHYLLLLSAFEAIRSESFAQQNKDDYFLIPENKRLLHDLIVREASWQRDGHQYRIDLAFRQKEKLYNGARLVYREGQLVDIGDLSTFTGFSELDASDMLVQSGKLYPRVFFDLKELQRETDFKKLLQDGYTDVRLQRLPPAEVTAELPLRLHPANTKKISNEIKLYTNPSLLLTKGNEVQYAIVNGKLYDVNR
ncbi:MAG TPA: peptidase M14 [Phaeodactylibacter sp.]|nr:peptidase M14 [Phaeodactylibacter sp.]